MLEEPEGPIVELAANEVRLPRAAVPVIDDETSLVVDCVV